MMRASAKLILVTCCMCSGIGLIGCATKPKFPPDGGYRTISVDPRRDVEKARQFNTQGMEFLSQDQLDLAAGAFSQALEADVEFGPSHNNLGKVYFRQKEWYKAAWEFEYAIQLLPKNPEPHNNLGLVLEESGQLDRAIEQYRQATALGAAIDYRANLARALIRRDGHTDETRALLQQILDQDTRPQWRDWARRELANP